MGSLSPVNGSSVWVVAPAASFSTRLLPCDVDVAGAVHRHTPGVVELGEGQHHLGRRRPRLRRRALPRFVRYEQNCHDDDHEDDDDQGNRGEHDLCAAVNPLKEGRWRCWRGGWLFGFCWLA